MRELPGWYKDGLCRNYPTKMWYEFDAVKDRAAKRICARCPSQLPCLEYALQNHETGVWGGLNDLDRRRLVRRIYVREALQVSSPHRTQHELVHPANASLVSQAHTSFPQMHSQQVLSTAAVLQAPVFPRLYKE